MYKKILSPAALAAGDNRVQGFSKVLIGRRLCSLRLW
jgi:hypothetical protein